jgi:glycosyltransferase involved in cell wall biosynthesis
MNRTLRILGTRGVPAAHGGFETFAEHLALYLTRQGWRVIVYCQAEGSGPISQDKWQGIERVTIPISQSGPKGTILFDWISIRHAAQSRELCLTLGYNTAVLCAWLRLKRVPNVFNMDGLEWRRAKWGTLAKTWFRLNEWVGCWLGNHLVADHPEIARHLRRRAPERKITTIAYGAKRILEGSDAAVRDKGLQPGGYLTLIARAEPENSVLEIVKGFSKRRRGLRLAVLGNYYSHYPYHVAVQQAASDEVLFLGAIYDKSVVEALRFHCVAYLHGHQVGGTNPSLVEALGAGNGARYFRDPDDLSDALDEVLSSPQDLARMSTASLLRFERGLTWDHVLLQYEGLLESRLTSGRRKSARRDEPLSVPLEDLELEPSLAGDTPGGNDAE